MLHQNTVCDFATSDIWVILSPIEQSIKRIIEAVGTPLKDWHINIYRGVLTGCNEAFIINTEKRYEILSNCQTEDERKRTEELIRPSICIFLKFSNIANQSFFIVRTNRPVVFQIERHPNIHSELGRRL